MNDTLNRTWQKLIVAHLKELSDIYLEEVKRKTFRRGLRAQI